MRLGVRISYRTAAAISAYAPPITPSIIKGSSISISSNRVMYQKGTPHMNLSLPDEVLRETTKCPSNKSCLSTGQCENHNKCDVEWSPCRDVLFLKSKEQDRPECPYRVSFGTAQVCRCPIKYAVYQQNNPQAQG